MHCLPESVVRRALTPATLVDIQFTNTAAKDFNGRLVYLKRAPTCGYVGKQYCVIKDKEIQAQKRQTDAPRAWRDG